MDALTHILQSLRLQSSLYFRTELTAPWGVKVPESGRVARFHIVIRGHCWLQVKGQEPICMSSGDLVIVPHGVEHTMADTLETPIRDLDDVLSDVAYTGSGPLIYGGAGPGCCLVCGEFSFDDIEAHPLLENLPPLLCIAGAQTFNKQWLDSAIGFIGFEASNEQPGAHAIVDRLSEIIFIQVLRATLAASEQHIPFLSAFADSRISTVLSKIHADPAADWTVEKLGKIAHMSRSAFSNRFSELANMTPLQYVSFVRMQQAAHKLREENQSLLAIAESVGYQSEAAFSSAFKKQFECRPGEYRRRYQKVV